MIDVVLKIHILISRLSDMYCAEKAFKLCFIAYTTTKKSQCPGRTSRGPSRASVPKLKTLAVFMYLSFVLIQHHFILYPRLFNSRTVHIFVWSVLFRLKKINKNRQKISAFIFRKDKEAQSHFGLLGFKR